MKRLSVIIVVVALGASAAVLNPPADLDPGIVETVQVDATDADIDPRFFFCPWALADGVNDTSVSGLSRSRTDYLISLPFNGEMSTLGKREIQNDRATSIEISSLQPVGESSAIVEFGLGPAGADVLAAGNGLAAADVCPSELPDVWHVGGGSTADGDRLTLRLFNPFLDVARVDLTVVSELGAEAATGFEGVSIPARSTKTIDIGAVLPGRQSLSIFVDNVDGAVIPALVRGSGGDVAVWSGVGESDTWELPLTVDGGLTGSIILTNSSILPVEFSIDVFSTQAEVSTPVTGGIEGPGQTVIPLADLGEATYGARITGDGPFGAVVVGVAQDARAAMAGVRNPSSQWILPGVNVEPGAEYRMWVLNTGVDTVVVSYGSSGGTVDGQLEVAAGAVASVDLSDLGAAGLIVEAASPFSVAWSVIDVPGVGYVAGIPVVGTGTGG